MFLDSLCAFILVDKIFVLRDNALLLYVYSAESDSVRPHGL